MAARIPKRLWATQTAAFHASRRLLASEQHFDTFGFVQRLEAEGFNNSQSEAIMRALAEVIEESMENLKKNVVTKAEQEKVRCNSWWRCMLMCQSLYVQKVDFTQLKSELQLLEKNDFTLMKAEHERLLAEVEKLRQKLREEVTRTQAGVRLDLNLEKGRMRDESSVLELKIKETDTKIESEIAGLRTQIETMKSQTLQTMVGEYLHICTGDKLTLRYNDRCWCSHSRIHSYV